VKKQLHIFKLEAFSVVVATSQNHEFIFLRSLRRRVGDFHGVWESAAQQPACTHHDRQQDRYEHLPE
jgi:hypothetical protein